MANDFMTYDVMTHDIMAYDVMTYDIVTYDIVIYDIITCNVRPIVKRSKSQKSKRLSISITTSLTCPPFNIGSTTPVGEL